MKEVCAMQRSIPDQLLTETARQLYPAAALALCSGSAARSAVTEAIVSALRKGGSDWQKKALSGVLRICAARADETAPDADFPAEPPLGCLARLPVQSRLDLALLAADIPRAEAAEARMCTEEELEKCYDKALWQMTFLQEGAAPDLSAMQRDAASLPQAEAQVAAIVQNVQAALREAEDGGDAPAPKVREIVRSSSAKQTPDQPKNAVSVPLWGILAAAAVMLCLVGAVIGMALSRRQPPPPTGGDEISTAAPEVIRQIDEKHAPAMAEAQDKVLEAAGKARSDVIFLNTKLVTSGARAAYEITFADSTGIQYEYVLNAETKAVTPVKSEPTDTVPDADGWLSTAQLRALALDFAGLESAVFTKEKLGIEDDAYYYKFEFTDADGRSYTVHVNVLTGALIKYSVKEADTVDTSRMISAEAAREQALARAGGLRSDQVIMTKEKREGTVYLIAFTLDDGTQYSIELNALTGMANTVDVNPVSADTSQMLGMLTARDIALQKAGLTEKGTRFTKAKLDRSNAVYVYELEFETDDNEYEISMNAVTGEILKYRVWML